MKFINSITDKESGISEVDILYKGKIYTGFAKCHEEDDWSEFTGCRIAETRAEIKALKEERKKMIAACDECKKFVHAIGNYKNFDKDSPSAKAMYSQLNRRIDEVNKLTERISSMMIALNASIAMQDKIRQRTLDKTE